ncbi:hypothetical protein CEXT_34741 [Caerostris extrusa]|uniref:Uncharacterized protein n=1 Tax=Caerostris extrusa TaxID=172846 RepID=A0AAV4VV71_CAEEX|nr:hypothetical protein CEXT_34741 [Caerostris extrusa]
MAPSMLFRWCDLMAQCPSSLRTDLEIRTGTTTNYWQGLRLAQGWGCFSFAMGVRCMVFQLGFLFSSKLGVQLGKLIAAGDHLPLPDSLISKTVDMRSKLHE